MRIGSLMLKMAAVGLAMAAVGNLRADTAAAPATAAAPVAKPTVEAGKVVTTEINPGKFVDITSKLDTIRAYWVTPKGSGPWPGIVVAHDIYGMTSFTKKQAEGLAGQGYAVLVPDLYSRLDVPDGMVNNPTEAAAAYAKTSDQQALADTLASVDFLANDPSVGAQPIAVVGIDMGGVYAMLAASKDLRVKGAVNYYGKIVYAETTQTRPDSPVDMLFNLKAPLLSFYGDEDPQNPPARVEELGRRLHNNPNKTWYKVVHYPGVGHGFLDPARVGYSAKTAEDASGKVKQFLAKVLRPPVAKDANN